MSKQLLKKVTLFTITMSATMLISTSAYADGAELYTAKGCNACHGVAGKAPIMGSYPKISGQNKEYLTQQLKDIKSGTRNNGQTAAMKAVMTAVSEDDIKAIAEYLAAVK